MTHRTNAVSRRQMPMTAGYDASRWRYLDRRHAKNENVQDDAEASRKFGSIGRQSWHESSRRSDPACIEQQKVGDEAVIRFRRFCVQPRTRQLLANGQPVELGSRAFDILMVLIKACGALVTKRELLDQVWPDTVVEEGNLQVQVSALRKVLSEDRDVIKTISGRGYVFVAEMVRAEPNALIPPDAGQARTPSRHAPPSNLLAFGAPFEQRPKGSRPAAPYDESRPTVVVIDEDRSLREALQGLLRSAGLRVELFASVREFLRSASRSSQDTSSSIPG
jgi:DNA-binding winged helix-turn-helix (wHTH) protein